MAKYNGYARPKDRKKTMKKMLHYMGIYKWSVALVALLVCISSLANIIGTYMLKPVINKYILPGDIPGLIRIIVLMAVMYGCGALATRGYNQLMVHTCQKIVGRIRRDLFEHTQELPVSYFDVHTHGELMSRFTNDVDTLSNALQETLQRVLAAILTFIFVIGMMFYIHTILACIAILIIPLSLIVTRFFVMRSQKLFDTQQETLGELNGTITEMYGGFNEIILYNRQKMALDKFHDVNDRMRKASFRAQFASSLISPCISLITYLIIGSVAVAGCLFVMNGTLLLGNLQAFVRYIWQINDPLSQISQLSSQVQSAFAAMGRIFNLMDEEEEVQDGKVEIRPEKFRGEVTFDHVVFGYDDETLMRDVNFQAKPGQMVAIVGPTGAGKTTLMNLLLRFYDVKGGAIKIDGIDIRDMNREELRQLFSLVLQDTWLFKGSIYDNIHYGRLTARKDEVISAAKMANVHHFIKTLTGGYNFEINEESSNISQGEKQLLTIARAILKDPRIIILDEATSSVDTRLEKMLQDAMHKVMDGRTSFVIAHRLSTVRNADLILVVDHGDIVEQGTHEELLAKKGVYENLYHSGTSLANHQPVC